MQPALGGTRVVRTLSAVSAVAVLCCVSAFVSLHVLPVSRRLNPVSVPLSNYALTPAGWLFNGGVLALIVGLLCLLAVLVAAGELSRVSLPVLVTAGCCLALTGVVLFPNRTLPDGALTPAAELHWVAAMAAFAGLPVAPLLLARRHRMRVGCSGLPRVAGWLARGASIWFVALLGGSIMAFTDRSHVWHVGGVVERALAGSEILAALLLTVWLWRGCRCYRQDEAALVVETADAPLAAAA
jgi:hypothetical membrane protein